MAASPSGPLFSSSPPAIPNPNPSPSPYAVEAKNMLSRSCSDLLHLAAGGPQPPPPPPLTRLPRVMTVPGILSDTDTELSNVFGGPPSPCTARERRIVVTNQLPLRAFRDPASGRWSFSWDPDALSFQLRSGLPGGSASTDIVHIGTLRADIDSSEQDEVAQILFEELRCVPVFLPSDLHQRFYHGFCKHYLWPLLHYLLPLSPAVHGGLRFDRRLWLAYLSANKLFADRVMEVISPDDDFVWAHDYHLLALPTFLRKRFPRIKLGFFLHSPFPSSEIFRTIPVRDEILRALLNTDLLGFHTYDYARHFLSCCSRLLGLDYESKRGYIGLDYYGRTVTIKILPVGVDMGQLKEVIASPETESKVLELKSKFRGKILLLGIDDMDIFKGIGFKFLAMEQLLEDHPELRGRAILLQIANPARSQGKDIQEVQEETRFIARRINEKYGYPGYDPIVFIDEGPLQTYEKIAYYAVSECCVVNPVRDGMNLVPYEYTVCRQGKEKMSMIVVSEFIGCSPSLSGAIRINPWNVDAVAEAMNSAITMPEAEKQLRHEKHYKYVSSHDVDYWARSFDQDLQRVCKDHFTKRCWGIGFGLNFRVVALGHSFRKLSVEHIVSAYKRTSSRLILLDYDGTMMPQSSINKAPSEEVVQVLNLLCADERNAVFVVSGRGKDSLSRWFDSCEKLGISAEHGYFTRWTRDTPWESSQLAVDLEWKNSAEPVMKLYADTTDGSYIERKESALVWHHQEADPDFGSCQAKELLDHLENVLANEPVVVKRGQHIVEVNPQGISKGVVVRNLMSAMKSRGKPPDFVLCIGDDRSDEDMFEAVMGSSPNKPPFLPVISEVFACTVGNKPSKAKYYLDDTVDFNWFGIWFGWFVVNETVGKFLIQSSFTTLINVFENDQKEGTYLQSPHLTLFFSSLLPKSRPCTVPTHAAFRRLANTVSLRRPRGTPRRRPHGVPTCRPLRSTRTHGCPRSTSAPHCADHVVGFPQIPRTIDCRWPVLLHFKSFQRYGLRGMMDDVEES
ncbi:Alpha,alpha-trehalose-phosphate synthase [UDP-forming] 6 [Apostasia shenzhenica]|uniref:Alpha,alpha-trehalose-phosphate synthase [UDP-forming] 6 n=1 Tax=Apostasia shenzhenica TaxID=1088818 RepID=A0A2I0A1L2_9ASPA|nr:Alpha,alpha-trehalose-phosphate synthase [UDP-forming] 6 [Apostasia shenzhenica]